MVFVTVGNAKQGFLRLLDAVDSLAGNGVFRGVEPVLVQSGHNPDFHSRHCEAVSFFSEEEFSRKLANADLIITHGGSTVMTAIALNKVPIVMPRQRHYGEVVNDHQVAFVKALTEEGFVVPAYEPDELERAIAETRSRRQRPRNNGGPQIADLVSNAIDELISICRTDIWRE